ncbi:MAG: tRNA threonylcarbamoyladenosine dehydratase [Eggerthellaceae bacterium]|nr:tRNA threonylcarbamoyladenosine dehydratase [Eggerthellaceae bacterium]
MMPDQFDRTRSLVGSDAFSALSAAHGIVFGIGGVGGHAAEALVRSGIGAIDLVDKDIVCITNVNRQIIATCDTVGKPKVDVAAQRFLSINPSCHVTGFRCFYLPETANDFDFSIYDYVVDAVDTVTAKLLIAERAQKANVPVISSMGAANKLDPTAFRVSDIYETSVDPLARVMRKECRKRGIDKLKVVYSQEAPRTAAMPSGTESTPCPARDRCPKAASCTEQASSGPASNAYVPAAAGLAIASEVVKDIISKAQVDD